MMELCGKHGRRMRLAGGERGFSIPEAMVVVVVLLVLAALARPALGSYLGNVKHKGAVSAVKRTLQAARSKALANPMVHCGVYFDVTSVPNRIVVFLDTHSPDAHAYDGGKDRQHLAPYVLPEGVELSVPDPNPAAIVFRGDGSACISGRAVVKSAAFSDTVDVLASTGRIRVMR